MYSPIASYFNTQEVKSRGYFERGREVQVRKVTTHAAFRLQLVHDGENACMREENVFLQHEA